MVPSAPIVDAVPEAFAAAEVLAALETEATFEAEFEPTAFTTSGLDCAKAEYADEVAAIAAIFDATT